MNNNAQGVDVSAIGQGNFDWNKWAGHIEFAIAKATDGTTFLDPEFERNWERMQDLSLYRFAYHYFRPAQDPVEQAHFFVNRVITLGLFDDKDNLCMDLEETDGLSPVDVSFAAWVFCTTVNRIIPDRRCLVYTYPAFAEAGNCAKLAGWPLWIADWGVPTPMVPVPWSHWAIWQESAYQSGNKDVFNGSLNDLEIFCATTGPWPT